MAHNRRVALPDASSRTTTPNGVLRPAAMCHGPGHLVRYGNPAFVAAFGPACLGLPARECLVALPADAFELLDTVLAQGRPYSRWIRIGGAEWRMTAAPRVDIGTGETYGVAFRLRSRGDPSARGAYPASRERGGAGRRP
jgi:hypothetical protein